MHIDKTVISFFGLFLLVYFLESIGGFFMTSAIVSIEKQFQIPSKVSGLMVSASDFGYIPTVVFVAYMGGKGNRAKWIGAGCILISVANVIISTSNFLFPVERVNLENSDFETSIERDLRRLPNANASFYSQLTPTIRRKIDKVGIRNFFEDCDQIDKFNRSDAACIYAHQLLHKENMATLQDVENLRVITGTTYAFCDRTLNRLRKMVHALISRIMTQNSDAKYSMCAKCVEYGTNDDNFYRSIVVGHWANNAIFGLPLIDDNVRKENLPLYFAGMFFIRILGPVLGMLMGSLTNKFYYTFDPPRGLTPKDPLWIGCWWMGFLAIGLILFGPSLGLYCFKAPKPDEEDDNDNEAKEKFIDSNDTKKTTKKRSPGLALVDRHLEKTADGLAVVPSSLKDKALDFFNTIRTVIKQPIYLGILTGRIIDVMSFKGFFIFLPKYLEIQFGIPQYQINFYMGLIGIIGFAIGVICGSLLMKKLKLEGRRAAGWVAVCSFFAGCLSFLNAGVGCRSPLTMLGNLPDNGLNTTFTCASGCFCDSTLYPVCDKPGDKVFFSPCHAGCAPPNITEFAALDFKSTPLFSNCSCANNAEVSRDFCIQEECNWKAKWYFFNMALGGMFGGLGVTPGMLIMLRSVPAKYRSISLGFNGFLVSLLATLPSPTAWGALIDKFCVLWDKKCDDQGACLLYNTDQLRIWMHCIYGTLRLFALLFDVFVFYHAKDLKLIEEEDDMKKEEEEEDDDDDHKSKPEISEIEHNAEIPKTENNAEVVDKPDQQHKTSKQHKRSASREIRLMFDEKLDESQQCSNDYMVGTISGITSNGVV